MAAEGWVFAGIDQRSLEDRISALTTKDPNKMRVYLDGYDSHSLRSFYYYRDEMPDIDESVSSINSIAKLYKKLRQKSKGPSFLLTYAGTWRGLMTNCGMSEEEAKRVEAKYHELYKHSDEWVQQKLKEAETNGYVTGAFGLKVRTPLLHKVIRGNSATPYEAEAEGRTAGNALGQSYCLLNTREGTEFMEMTMDSPYALDIKQVAAIHDAVYMGIKKNHIAIKWANDKVVKCAEWQDHPDIYHDEVKLGGELGIFWPSWANECQLDNYADLQTITSNIKYGVKDYFSKYFPDID